MPAEIGRAEPTTLPDAPQDPVPQAAAEGGSARRGGGGRRPTAVGADGGDRDPSDLVDSAVKGPEDQLITLWNLRAPRRELAALRKTYERYLPPENLRVAHLYPPLSDFFTKQAGTISELLAPTDIVSGTNLFLQVVFMDALVSSRTANEVVPLNEYPLAQVFHPGEELFWLEYNLWDLHRYMVDQNPKAFSLNAETLRSRMWSKMLDDKAKKYGIE